MNPAHKSGRVGFSYLLALSVVSFTRFAWLPWIVLYMYQRKYNSWSATVSAYGVVLTCFQIGQYAGNVLNNSKALNSSWFTISFMTLTGSFIALCFVTRITIVLLLFALMGLSGSILSGVSVNTDVSIHHQMAFLKKAQESLAGDALERNLISFAFVVLLAGYLYDARPLSQLPMYSLAITLSVFCMLITGYFVLLSRTISARGRGGKQPSELGNSNTDKSSAGTSQKSAGSAIELGVGDGAEQYNGPVPANFLSACGGNLAKARTMYGKALKWRRDKRVDEIFDIPQEFFHDILKYYPHGIHGYSKDGCAVVYETLGKGDMAGLKRLGTTIEQIAWHFELRNELVFRRLLEPDFVRQHGGVVLPYTPPADPNIIAQPVRRLMTVLDVAGISFSAVTADVLTFIKMSGDLIDNYYPEQVARLVICNAPWWFSKGFGVIAAVLPEAVQKKVDFLSDCQSLDKYIDPSQRPVEYAGTGGPLGTGVGHLEFLALERAWREKDGGGGGAAGRVRVKEGGAGPAAAPAPSSSTGAAPAATNSEPTTKASSWQDPWKLFKRHKPVVADLGHENTLRYDPVSGRWYDDSTTEEAAEVVVHKKGKGKKGSDAAHPKVKTETPASRLQEQVKDHALMLAIHAAHQVGGGGAGLEEGLPSGMHSVSFHETDDAEERRSRSSAGGGGGSEHVSMKLLSPLLFLLVVSGYLICLWIQTALFTLIPVWMVIPASAGGMEYSVREVSLVLSSAAVFALVGHKLLGRRCEHILRASPVRSLRIGCGLLLVVLFLLPSYMEFTARPVDLITDQNQPVAGDDAVQSVTVFGKALPSHVPLSYSTFAAADHHNVAYDYVHWASSKYIFHHRSVLALQLPAVFLALMLCALQLCRRASGVLLHLALTSSFHQPASIRRALNGCMDVAGPTLSGLLFSLIYGLGLQYPLDASSFFSISGCSILLVYIGTMLLQVQFRGDYGVLPDYHEPQLSNAPRRGDRTATLDGGMELSMDEDEHLLGPGVHHRTTRRGQDIHHCYRHGASEGIHARSPGDGDRGGGLGQWFERVFAVPLSDANLLYSPIFAAYGSKLHNLKDDFKDL